MSKPYEDEINAIADSEGVPRAVAQALVDTEDSERDPFGSGDEGLWGGGSYGLVRITLPTAQEYGYPGADAEGLKDVSSVRWGLRYLLAMFRRFGSWPEAYAGYNAGPDRSPYPTEHVARFSRNLEAWQARYAAGPPGPPILTAGIGGALLAVAVLGFVLPELVRRFRNR